MKWAVQYLGADRRWRLIVNSCSESRAEAVVSLRERRRVSQDEDFRLVRLTTKSEKLERLLAIEEQAKRVARAEKWVSMADLALLDANESDLWNSRDTWKRARAWENLCNEAWTMACSGFQSERRKLYEMVGEGES